MIISSHKNILLIQGPMGPFFDEFAKFLFEQQNDVFKINLNLAEKLFYNQIQSFDYTGPLEGFKKYLTHFIETNNIQQIFVFGDCRSYHRIAKSVSNTQNIDFFVFELGYIRPNYITLEQHGVNNYSKLPRDLDFYINENTPSQPVPINAHPSYAKMAFYSSLYYFINKLPFNKFKSYTHHKNPSYIREALIGIKSAYRKVIFSFSEYVIKNQILKFPKKSYFVVPIQVSSDFQIIKHSDYPSVANFIEEIIKSYSEASIKQTLIFKHHPMDRGHANYTSLIKKLSEQYNVSNEVFYVHDIYLPVLLERAKGTILINSTVAFSSFYHDTPVKVMGRANYDFANMSYQGPLEDFWHDESNFNPENYTFYKNYLIKHTQVNGSFYGMFPKFIKPDLNK